MNAYNASLADLSMPERIRRLPISDKGFPVPAFVQWMKDGEATVRGDGEPNFVVADAAFRVRAFRVGLCWVCGDPLGRHRVYVIGPMCVINRVTSEPASHRECAEFAARSCPFLVQPRAKRNAKAVPEDGHVDGIHIDRNPGVTCLYETSDAKAFGDGAGGWLIRLGKPERVDWWAQGRAATLAEVAASIESGYPLLMAEARKDGQLAALNRSRIAAMRLLPAA